MHCGKDKIFQESCCYKYLKMVIKSATELQEGQVLNNIFYTRMIRGNQNILAAIVGKTGSGKSYSCLRICELWYEKCFNKEFPIENCCFSIEQLMERLVSGNLDEGDMLILEEAGTSMSALEFQSKVAKSFNYILQSFRNRNIGVIANLPFFSMLNKTTRMLLHMRLQTMEIKNGKVILKPFNLQWSQENGKLYRHYPKMMIGGVYESIERVGYSLPSKKLRDAYELKKATFVANLSKDVLYNIKNANRRPLTELQTRVKEVWDQGITNQTEIAKNLNVLQQYVSRAVISMRHKGYPMNKPGEKEHG